MQFSGKIQAGIQAYLESVSVNLRGMRPDEREEILNNIESHVHDALAERAGQHPTVEDLQAVLTEMAPAESYASDRPAAPPPLPSAAVPERPQRSLGKWALAMVVVGLIAAGVIAAAGAVFARTSSAEETAYGIAVALGVVLELLALILGLCSLREQAGKIALCISSILLFLVIVVFGFLWLICPPGRIDHMSEQRMSAGCAPYAISPGERSGVATLSPIARKSWPIYEYGQRYRLVRRERIERIKEHSPRKDPPQYLILEPEVWVSVADETPDGQKRFRIEYRGLARKPAEGYAVFDTKCAFMATLDASGAMTRFEDANGAGSLSAEEKARRAMIGEFMKETLLEPVRYLPTEEVEVGETWTVRKNLFCLMEFAGLGRGVVRLKTADDTITCKLAKVIETDNGPVAVIELYMKSGVAAGRQGPGELREFPPGFMSFVLTGELRYNLRTGEILSHRVDIRSIEPDREGVAVRIETELRKADSQE